MYNFDAVCLIFSLCTISSGKFLLDMVVISLKNFIFLQFLIIQNLFMHIYIYANSCRCIFIDGGACPQLGPHDAERRQIVVIIQSPIIPDCNLFHRVSSLGTAHKIQILHQNNISVIDRNRD